MDALKNTALKFWLLAERFPNLAIGLLVVLQTAFSLNNRAFWYSDEVRYANAYQNLVEGGHWIVLNLNGVAYPDKPPLYFWMLGLIDMIPGFNGPAVFFAGSALSGFLFVAAARYLGAALGFSRLVQVGAALILLSAIFVESLFHYVRMDLLFSTFILLSTGMLYKHYVLNGRTRLCLQGFFAAGIAVLIKGPLGIIFPLITLIVFLIWTGKIERFFTRTTLLGFVAFLFPVALWAWGVIWVESFDFLFQKIFGMQMIERATDAFHHKEPVCYYFAILPVAFLPWTGFLVAVPFLKMADIAAVKTWFSSRREQGPFAFSVISSFVIFAFLSSLSGKVAIYVLPILPFLAFLVAKTIHSKSKAANKGWIGSAVLLTVFASATLFTLPLVPSDGGRWGVIIGAVLLYLAAATIWKLRNGDPRILLIFVSLISTLWIISQSVMTFPVLDHQLSPRDHAIVAKTYIDQGYTPVAFSTYSGVFTYYVGQDLYETNDPKELTIFLQNNDRVVLLTLRKSWESNPVMTELFEIVFEQNISGGGGVYLVAITKPL